MFYQPDSMSWQSAGGPHQRDRARFGRHRRAHHPEGRGPGGREHPGRGGPRGRRFVRERMERGALRPIILDALRDAPRHGYEIIKSFEERSRGQYAPSPGAVYPTLQYLEDLGWVRSDQNGDRRVYELTEAGRAELAAREEKIQAFWAEFAASAPSEQTLHDVRFLREDLDNLTGTIWTGLRQAIADGNPDQIRQVRGAVQRCQEEIRGFVANAAVRTSQ